MCLLQAGAGRNPGFGLTDLVIIYQQIGQSDEARRMVEQLMAARPNFTIGGWLETQSIRRDTAQVETDTMLFAPLDFRQARAFLVARWMSPPGP
jgi:hypothetical protein